MLVFRYLRNKIKCYSIIRRSLQCSTDDNIINLNRNLSNSMSYTAGCYQTHSLPRRSCIHHLDEYHTNSLPRSPRMEHHAHDHENNHLYSEYDKMSMSASRKHNENSMYASQINQSPSYVNVANNELQTNQLQKVPQLISTNQEEILCSTCSSSSNSDESGNEYCGVPCESEGEFREPCGQSATDLDKNKNEKEIFIDFKPILKQSPELYKSSEYENEDIKCEKLTEKAKKGKEVIKSFPDAAYCDKNYARRSTQDLPSEESDLEKRTEDVKPQENSFIQTKNVEHPKTKLDVGNFDKAYYSSEDEEKVSFESNTDYKEDMHKKHPENIWNISQQTVILKQNFR